MGQTLIPSLFCSQLHQLILLLPASQRTFIVNIITLVIKVQQQVQSGNKGGASSIMIEIEKLLKQISGGAKGDDAKGSGAEGNGAEGPGASAGKGAKGAAGKGPDASSGAKGIDDITSILAKHGKGKSLSPQDITEIESILTKIVGPKLAKIITHLLIALVNGLLRKIPIHEVIEIVVKLLVKLLKSHGILSKVLTGGKPGTVGGSAKQANGKLKNLTPADQARLTAILNKILGPYTSKYLVVVVTQLINGLLGKLPLHSVLHSVTGLLTHLLGGNNIVAKLLGRQGKMKRTT